METGCGAGFHIENSIVRQYFTLRKMLRQLGEREREIIDYGQPGGTQSAGIYNSTVLIFVEEYNALLNR